MYFTVFGGNKLEVKTKTGSGVEFTSKLDHNHDTGKVGGCLETKYKWKDYGKFFISFLKTFSDFFKAKKWSAS